MMGRAKQLSGDSPYFKEGAFVPFCRAFMGQGLSPLNCVRISA
jgi:hypothetical protein